MVLQYYGYKIIKLNNKTNISPKLKLKIKVIFKVFSKIGF